MATKKAKPAKKASPAIKSKPAKKAAEKSVKKSPTKLAKKKIVKKTAKKVVRKVVAKSPTKLAKKKTVKKSAKKTVKKVAVKSKTKNTKKNTTKKPVKKTNSKPKTKVEVPDLDLDLDKLMESEIFASSFMFTGTMNSMQRKDAENKVKELGGKILSSVSDKLDYLVAGEKAGSKLAAAKKIKSIKIIDEKTFLSMLSEDSSENNSNGSNTEVDGKYKIKFDIYGYGGEHCVTQLDKKQYKYWKKKFDDDAYEAGQELKDHLWNYEDGDEIPETHFGKWYDQGSIVHAERAFYSESSRLMINVFKDDEEIESIELEVTDQKIKKEFYEEFVPNPKKDKGKAFLYTGSSDRGSYCHGEYELPEGQKFDISKISLVVKYLFDDSIVWNVCYDGEYLDDEGCYDSTGKGFNAEIYFI